MIVHKIFFHVAKSLDFGVMEKTLQEYTHDIIELFLKKYNNNVLLVAEKLDIGKSTIYNMIKKGKVNGKE